MVKCPLVWCVLCGHGMRRWHDRANGSRAVSVWRGCWVHGLQDVSKWSSGNWSMQAAVSQTW